MVKMRRRYAAAGILLSFALVVAACGDDDDTSTTESTDEADAGDSGDTALPDTVKLGVLTSLTGPHAGSCSDERDGGALAVELANERQSDVKFELVQQDDVSTPEGAVTGFAALLDEDVAAIYGLCNSQGALAVYESVDDAGVPLMLTTASATGVIDPDLVFRGGANQLDFVHRTAELVGEDEHEKVYAVHQTDNPVIVEEWEDIFKPQFEELGIEVVGDSGITADMVDYSTPINEIRSSDATAIVLLLSGKANITFNDQAKSAGLALPVYGQLSMANKAYVETPSSVGSIFGTSFDPSFPFPAAVEFKDAFEAKYGRAPYFSAAGGYDSANRLINAILESESIESADIADALNAQGDIEGAQGSMTTNPDGSVKGTGGIVKVTAVGKTEFVR